MLRTRRLRLPTRSSRLSIAILLALSAVVAMAPATRAADAPWLHIEIFYLSLLNCTRTGGWVLADGSCDKYGSGHYSPYREPLRRHKGVSRDVARPYAKRLAREQILSHYLGGSPETRMRRAGYDGSAYGENLAWAGRRPRRAVIWAQRYFQDEKSYHGPHWGNLKRAAYETVGIGVWYRDGRTYLATDFFTP
jgi:hypothetical protein